ncbi:MAG TPA: hypothetical protein VD994_06565 [Prosthecobacter sp.]|nr:hypothetical protein [Prosthecobacter sp.]
MSKPFSFFSLSRPDGTDLPAAGLASAAEAAVPPPVLEPSPSTPLFEAAQLSPTEPSELPSALGPASGSLFHRPIPYMAPLGSTPGSVLSGALHGSPPAREVPSPNQRPSAAPAAPSSILPTQAPSPWNKPNASPAPGASWSPGQVSSREIAQLRLDVREELEQVKNDLFGAATGVSALKDRLDGLEHQMAKAPIASGVSLEDLQTWINGRIEQAVQAAVERTLEAVLGSGVEAARAALRAQPQDRPSLSQAPVVLSSSPS